jgi:acetolactate synthase-1/2/3 large subunit
LLHPIEITDPSELAGAFDAASEVFEACRPRPVHIGIPRDVLAAPAPSVAGTSAPRGRPVPPAAEIARAGALLAAAERPIILIGGGAVDAGTEVAGIAARIGAPVVMTINAKGVLADDHPLSLGTTLALASVVDELEHADVVLAVGTEFAEIDYYYTRTPRFRGRLVRVDLDADELRRSMPADVALLGDAARTLTVLDATLGEAGADRRPDGASRAADIAARGTWWPSARTVIPAIDTIAGALPRNTIIAADSNEIAYVANHYAPAWNPRSWLAPGGYGTLGAALPMAIGAKLAARDRPVVAILGDGGLLFTIQDLGTAADLELGIVVLLWNNGGYGAMREAMDAASVPRVGTEVTAGSFASIVKGFGCGFESVESVDELEHAVSAALGRGALWSSRRAPSGSRHGADPRVHDRRICPLHQSRDGCPRRAYRAGSQDQPVRVITWWWSAHERAARHPPVEGWLPASCGQSRSRDRPFRERLPATDGAAIRRPVEPH